MPKGSEEKHYVKVDVNMQGKDQKYWLSLAFTCNDRLSLVPLKIKAWYLVQ